MIADMVLGSPHQPLNRTTQDIRLLSFDTTLKAPSESNLTSAFISLFLSHAPLSASPPPFQAMSIRDALQLSEWMILSSNIDPKYRWLYEFLGAIVSNVVHLEKTLNAYRLILRKGKDCLEKTKLRTVLTYVATAFLQKHGLDVLCSRRGIARWTDRGLPSAPRNPFSSSVNLDGPGGELDFDATDGLPRSLYRTAETTVIRDSKIALFLPRAVVSTVIRMGSEFTSVPRQEVYRRNSGLSSSVIRNSSMFEARHSTQSSLVKTTHCTQSLVKANGERPEFLQYLTTYRAWLEETLNLPHHPCILRAPVLTSDAISLHQTHITYSSEPLVEVPRAPRLCLSERSGESQLGSPVRECASSPEEGTGDEMKHPPVCVATPDESMFETFMRMNISRAVGASDSAPNLQGIDPIHREPHHIVNLIASLKGL
ncbi:hypothetical protein QR685DRAFT_147739 [Neurospora intermedia]|uniref:Uncharacterized protein n=1 Tax=Neurospora intermedia TaxID=5142 RepID=A0ABR3CXB2_NEUIN